MGAVQPAMLPWGGRWTAVYSLWTYFHRLLHVLGVAAVDAEELSLLSGPLVRITSIRPRKEPLVLAHHPDHLHPDEPLGWFKPSQIPALSSLFYLHFDESDTQHPDKARLATAAPVPNSPRAWLLVDGKTGVITLTHSKIAASVFSMRTSPTHHPAAVSLQCPCMAGRYLTVHPETKRARVGANSVRTSEMFLLTNVQLPPTLSLRPPPEPAVDYTMAVAYQSTRKSRVRIQSVAFGWFLASKPGSSLVAASSSDAGWDGFTLEYDSFTKSVRICDSSGIYFAFDNDHKRILAGATVDDPSKNDQLDDCPVDAHPKPERFALETSVEDDQVVLRSRKGYLSARRGGSIVISQNTTPKKREQFYLRLALPSMMDQSTPRLRLRHFAGGARQVEATVLVPVSADIGYEVLSDYNGFHEFLSGSSESRVLERSSSTKLIVHMVQCHSFLMLTIPMTMVLDVEEAPESRKLQMNLKKGLGIKEYKGLWQAIEQPDGRCLLKCCILASTAVPAPGFLMDGLMNHATHTAMLELRTECIRRSTLAKSNPSESRKQHRRNRSLRQIPPL